MARRFKRHGDTEIGRQAAVLDKGAGTDTGAEEQRQIRSALTEYFSILHEWSRTKEEGTRTDESCFEVRSHL